MKKTLVIVGGPTASGKTRLAIDLALHFKTEIISADSRQLFTELTIGTAKPSEEELNTVKHHFINSHSIKEPFNAGDYGVEARKLLDELFSGHDVVIMAGGSGLYIDAVISGFDDLPPASNEIREMLGSLFHSSGIEALQKLYQEKDPEGFSKIDIDNHRRLTRALEVCLTTGKPYSSFLGKKNSVSDYNIIMTGIDLPRELLYARINERVNKMIAAGLEKEVRGVYQYKDHNALKTVGYKEMFEFIEGDVSLNEAVEKIAKNTRNYAKRQLTWFRKYDDMIWGSPDDMKNLIDIIQLKMTL